jgi:antitoxin MazE
MLVASMYKRWYNVITPCGPRYSVLSMIKKLSKHGNSLALVMDRSILDLLHIDEKTSLSISTDGESIVVSPVRDKKRRQRFEEALASSNERYGKALKRLAE